MTFQLILLSAIILVPVLAAVVCLAAIRAIEKFMGPFND